MSMAGLRYCPRSPTGPLETKSGAYVYSGEPSHFHEWQFRTLLRVELCKKKMEQKAKEASSSPVSPASSGRRRRQPTDAARQEDAEEEAAVEVSPQAPSGSGEHAVPMYRTHAPCPCTVPPYPCNYGIHLPYHRTHRTHVPYPSVPMNRTHRTHHTYPVSGRSSKRFFDIFEVY